MFQNSMRFNGGNQYDDYEDYGDYNQNQYNGYSNQNFQSTVQTPVQQSSIPVSNQPSTQPAGGRLLRKGIISLNRKEPPKADPPKQQLQPTNENSYISSQPTITKPKVNGPTQIPQEFDFEPNYAQNKVPIQQQNRNKFQSINQQPYYDNNDYYDDYQQPPQYYEEDNNDNYTNQMPVKINLPKPQNQQVVQLPKPQKQQITPKQSQSYNYDYDTPNISNVDLFKQRQPMIESQFASSLERSMNNFKRVFANEFQVIMRQVQSQGISTRSLFDVDEYCENLKSDINSLILSNLSNDDGNDVKIADNLQSKNSNISRKVGAAIDEYTKPFSALLAESSSRNSIQADHHISELRQLQEELESLINIYRTTSDSIVKELQRESQNAASIRDKEQMRYRNLEQKMRTMRMKRSELENRANKLSSDRQNIESEMKVFEQKKQKWEEEALPLFYDESGALRQKIMQKLSEIKSSIENEASFNDVIEAVDDGIKTIKEESDNMKNEIIDLEMANKTILQRANEFQLIKNTQNFRQFQQMQMNSNSYLPNSTMNSFNNNLSQRSPRRQSSILSEAQEKLEVMRKKREEAMKIISSQIL
ncbi:hypothetical protein M9Y10_027414 [Tritrichomonas musculus]|uniref:Uncharacterized protein n=1 Tax=Tritrichomonas musculus TaxID=1915356 RepID=A0ABR2H4R7_9EUKA